MTRPVTSCECGEHAFVVLTRGFVALIDPEFAPAMALWDWFAKFDGKNWYASRTTKRKIKGESTWITVRMHQMILPVPAGFMVDHKDGNTLNNRRGNLRFATNYDNTLNRKSRLGCTSNYRGVSRRGNGWYASITVGGQQINLGTYRDEIEAARAYDRAAVEHHGDFARLNFELEGAQ